ncbi:hypothetical protein H4R99_007837 [Coemansia sp. RSA 1722]|nr:hypothetical protein H4R99_007837 [Coemansia sp. RSA 1722]
MNGRPLARGIPGDILLPYYLADNDYSLTRARQTSESSSDELVQSNSDTDLSSESSSTPELPRIQGNEITVSNVQGRADQFIDEQIASQNGNGSDSEYFNFTDDDIHRESSSSSSSEEDSDSENNMPMFDAQPVLEQAAEYWSDDEPTHDIEEDEPLSDNAMEVERNIINDEEEMQTEVSVNDDHMETEPSEMSVVSDLTNTLEIPSSNAIEISEEGVEPIIEELETIQPTDIEELDEDLV